ncbi:MAG: hypothetical protein RLZZ182_1837 [Pseudomonadota bacterium]|jgi:hypothetical protein
MFRRNEPAKSFDGATPAQRAHVKIDGGPLINEIFVAATTGGSAAAAADIEYIEVKIGSDTKFKLSGAQIVLLEDYHNRTVTSGTFPVTFADITMTEPQDQLASSLTTRAGEDIELAVKSAAAVTASVAFLGDLEVADYGIDDDGNIAPVAKLQPRVRFLQLKGGPAGEVIIDNVHQLKDGGEWIKRIHFGNGSTDYITNVKVIRDNETLFDRSVANMRMDAKRHGKDPQANYVHFDTCLNGNAEEMLNTEHKKHLRFVLTLSTAMTDIPAIIETVERNPNVA